RREREFGLGQAALAAETDSRLEGVQRRSDALQGIAGDAEVVLHGGSVTAGTALKQQLEDALELGDAPSVAEVGGRHCAIAERAGRLRKAELLGDRDRAIDGRDRLGERAAEPLHA